MKRMDLGLFGLFAAIWLCAVNADLQIGSVRAHLVRRHNRRSSNGTEPSRLLCVNGNLSGAKCSCNWGYRGTHCEKKMFCNSYERQPNGSCIECVEGYSGDDCVDVNCKHGSPHPYEQNCVCVPPYKGKFCDSLETGDVYLLYNSRVAVLGPLGALSIIPLIMIYYGCEHFAKKRQIRRIEQTWIDQANVSVDSDRVKYLLEQ